MMRLLRYALVPWTAVLIYTFFSFFMGQNGIYAQKHLEAEYLRLLENKKALEYTKDDFLKTKNNLLYDHDTLSVYARQLGYGTEDERFIRIKGLNNAINTDLPVGHVLYAAPPDYVSDTVIKIISACFGLAVLAFFLIKDIIVGSDT